MLVGSARTEKVEMETAIASIDFHSINNACARKGFYYVTSYVNLIGEIRLLAAQTKTVNADTDTPTEKREYYRLYQRLHSYGGFEWDTNTFGTNPNL